jgi:hypothetical protein
LKESPRKEGNTKTLEITKSNREFHSKEIDERNSQLDKHDDPRISMSSAISICEDVEKLRGNLKSVFAGVPYDVEMGMATTIRYGDISKSDLRNQKYINETSKRIETPNVLEGEQLWSRRKCIESSARRDI